MPAGGRSWDTGGGDDAGTQYVQLGFFSKCQARSAGPQLEDGFRYLDIRFAASGDGPGLNHGFCECRTGAAPWSGRLMLEECYAFLTAHPIETVIFAVKREHRDESAAEFQRISENVKKTYLDFATKVRLLCLKRAREALIQCVCGILRKFCTIILLRFLEINTIIPAKSRRILAQNFFAICFCRFNQSFPRACLKIVSTPQRRIVYRHALPVCLTKKSLAAGHPANFQTASTRSAHLCGMSPASCHKQPETPFQNTRCRKNRTEG